jgi:hypothetical protein
MADRTIFYAQQGRRAVKLIFESVLAGSFLVIAVLLAGEPIAIAQQNPQGRSDSCAADNGSIALSPGFCATVFADNLGHRRAAFLYDCNLVRNCRRQRNGTARLRTG